MARGSDKLGVIGVVMLALGAYFFFGSQFGVERSVPLWVAWIVGPLLWYLGFAVLTVWVFCRAFMPEEKQPEAKVMVMKVSSKVSGPAGVTHEIPAMGGFIFLLLVALLLAPATARAADASDGAASFKAKCAMCHGADAAGKTVMGEKLGIKDLRSSEVQKQSDADLAQIISKGKNKMPAYDGKLSSDQVQNVVAFIRTTAKK
jgi:mono/diheme cytochrome c family protein